MKQDEAGAITLLKCIWDPVPEVVVHLSWKLSLPNIYLVEIGEKAGGGHESDTGQ